MNTHIKYKYRVIVEYLSKYTKQHFLGLTVNTSTAEADGMSDCMYLVINQRIGQIKILTR